MDTKLSYYPELMLKHAGLHPFHKSKVSFFYNHYFNCVLFIFLLILAALEVILSLLQNDPFRAIEGLSAVLFMTYTFCRYIINFRNKHYLAKLLNKQSLFWKTEDIQGPIREECDHLMHQAQRFITYYNNYAFTLVALFYLQPFIFHELQMKIFAPKGWFYWLYFLYCYMTPPLFVSVYGVTSMFCALCIPVVVQFKLLAHSFRTVKMHEMKKLVDYHNFLLRYCQTINAYSKAVLLFEYFITVSLCCILIFISVNDYPFVDKIKYAGFIVSQFLDTAVYCYSAELIMEASENVGTAVFDSGNNHRDLLLVLIRAQKQVIFDGYGLIRINMATFTKVFKATISFVSYLNTMAKN